MSLHKLMTEREGRAAERALQPAQMNVNLEQSLSYLGDAVVRARAIQACDFDLRTLPAHRTMRWSVSGKIGAFFDKLSMDPLFAPLRANESVTLLTAPGAFVYAHVTTRAATARAGSRSGPRARRARQRLRRTSTASRAR